MARALDVVHLGVPDVDAAREFHSAALGATVGGDADGAFLDLHGAGRLALHPAGGLAAAAGTPERSPDGFGGVVLSVVVARSGDVDALLEGATAAGATIVKPGKKILFGAFSGAYRAPDGSLWQVTAPKKGEGAGGPTPPTATETQAMLGAADPRTSKAFYVALGMTPDRDYGSKYLDFAPGPGAGRLAFMTRGALATQVAADPAASAAAGVVLGVTVEDAGEVDAVLAAATRAGGRITAPATTDAHGHRTGHVADPDGFVWRVAAD